VQACGAQKTIIRKKIIIQVTVTEGKLLPTHEEYSNTYKNHKSQDDMPKTLYIINKLT
jgi:hypothetical protein